MDSVLVWRGRGDSRLRPDPARSPKSMPSERWDHHWCRAHLPLKVAPVLCPVLCFQAFHTENILCLLQAFTHAVPHDSKVLSPPCPLVHDTTPERGSGSRESYGVRAAHPVVTSTPQPCHDWASCLPPSKQESFAGSILTIFLMEHVQFL